jgi:hypothetical protein
MMSA